MPTLPLALAESYYGYMWIMGIAVLFVVWLIRRNDAKNKRAAGLRILAQTKGLKYDKKKDETGIATTALPDFFADAIKDHFISGPLDNGQFIVFRAWGSEDSGTCSIAVVKSPGLALPGFTIQPRSLSIKIAATLGYSEVHLPDAPALSKRVNVQGEEAKAIADLFTPEVCNFYSKYCTRFTALHACGRYNYLIFWIQEQDLEPEIASALIELATEALNCFSPVEKHE